MISGGSGLIGKHLTSLLLSEGYKVSHLSRYQAHTVGVKTYYWDPGKNILDPSIFRDTEYLIHLAGANIGERLWTKKRKKVIAESRVESARLLHKIISTNNIPLKAFISASAAGYYGNRGETQLDEGNPPGQGFLADVCVAWEARARNAEKWGMRSVQVRTAPVLLKGGGLLKQLMKSMSFGFTFRFGSGNQWFPWVHMTDLIRIYHLAITDETLSGPVNACAPQPVRFRDFLAHLTRFKKALVIPFPVRILKLFLQETADVLLFSQRMRAAKLLERNFEFSFPTIEEAFRDIFVEGEG